MKLSRFLVCMTAATALAACNQGQQNPASNEPLNITPIAPPQGGDWSQIVSATAEGGMRMGNPDAKVKLVEIGAFTCPHCREFDEAALPDLVDKYVKTGQVSWEFRPYLLNGLDVPANLIARCNGVNSFFPLMRALFKDQSVWIGKVQAAPEAQVTQLLTNNQFAELAKVAGLQDWGAARGVAQAKSEQCLRDKRTIDQLVQQTATVTDQYPKFRGTPSFIINGEMIENTTTWQALEPKLREALS